MESLSTKVLILFLFACWFYLQATAADTALPTYIQTRNMRGVKLYLLPRSQWDPEQTYVPGRVVATRAMLECIRTVAGSTYECAESRPVWHTMISRDQVWEGFMKNAERKHEAPLPHLVTLLRSYNNMTYYEIPLSLESMPLDPESQDYALMEQGRLWAIESPRKVVLRWDQGRLWRVPMSHWNIGERALHSGVLLHTEWRNPGGDDDGDAAYDERLPIDMSHAIFTAAAHVTPQLPPVKPVAPRPPPVIVEETPDTKVISTRPPPSAQNAADDDNNNNNNVHTSK